MSKKGVEEGSGRLPRDEFNNNLCSDFYFTVFSLGGLKFKFFLGSDRFSPQVIFLLFPRNRLIVSELSSPKAACSVYPDK